MFRVCYPPYHSELKILVFFFLLVNLSFQSKCGRMCASPLSVRPPTVTSLMVCRHCLGGSLSWWNSENPPLCSECSVAGIIPKYPALCFISTHEIPLRHFFVKVGVWGNFKLPVGKKLAVRALSCSFQTKSLGQRRRLEVNVVYYYTSNRRLIIILNGCAGQPAVLVLLKADFAHLPKGIISIA